MRGIPLPSEGASTPECGPPPTDGAVQAGFTFASCVSVTCQVSVCASGGGEGQRVEVSGAAMRKLSEYAIVWFHQTRGPLGLSDQNPTTLKRGGEGRDISEGRTRGI